MRDIRAGPDLASREAARRIYDLTGEREFLRIDHQPQTERELSALRELDEWWATYRDRLNFDDTAFNGARRRRPPNAPPGRQ